MLLLLCDCWKLQDVSQMQRKGKSQKTVYIYKYFYSWLEFRELGTTEIERNICMKWMDLFPGSTFFLYPLTTSKNFWFSAGARKTKVPDSSSNTGYVENIALITWLMSKCSWRGWKWCRGVKEIAAPFPCCPVNRECSWKKSQIEIYMYITKTLSNLINP